ncbi:MAG: acyl-CoA dehydrogenase family protein [Polyangiaceae bacterium]
MDSQCDDSHRDRARAFAAEEVAVSATYRDHERRWDPGLFRRMGERGLLGATVPVEHGGSGLSAADLSQLLMAFGEGGTDAGLCLSWAAHTLGCAMPIAWFGDAAQRLCHLPALCRGEKVGAFAHAEPQIEGDRLGIGARAVRGGGGFVLNGEKTWVVNGAVADLFVVTARTDVERGKEGVSTFLIERATPGLRVSGPREIAGMRSAAVADITLRDCYVPSSALLGPEVAGWTQVVTRIVRWERALVGAAWVGVEGALLKHATARARERLDLGQPLSRSQAIRARLADLRIRHEHCKCILAQAAWAMDHDPETADRAAVTARLFIAKDAAQASRDALSIFGADGDPLAERIHRDALVFDQLSGGADRLRSVLAGSLFRLG